MKKKIIVYSFTFIALILVISISYNILSKDNINVSTSIIQNSWNISISDCKTNIDKSSNNYSDPIINNDNGSINYNISLNSGDNINVSVTIKNKGSVDAVLGSVPFISGLNDEELNNISYSFNYNNGDNVLSNDLLRSGESTTIIINIKNISNTDLNNLNFDIGFNYIRK